MVAQSAGSVEQTYISSLLSQAKDADPNKLYEVGFQLPTYRLRWRVEKYG